MKLTPTFRLPWLPIRGALACVLILLLAQLFAVASEARPPRDDPEAQKWLTEVWTHAKQRQIEFKQIDGVTWVTMQPISGPKLGIYLSWINAIRMVKENGQWVVYYKVGGQKDELWLCTASESYAQRFYQALLYLTRESHQAANTGNKAALEKFKAQAEQWRALVVKPAMTEEAYKHKVLAEEAYRNKDLVKAWLEYEQALQVFPTWPEGQFNAALLNAELEHYRGATFRMQEYLMLAPDAPDAQSARDKVIIWQDKVPRF